MIETALVVMLMAASGPQSPVEVRLRASVVCSAPVVRLCDVAEIRGTDAVQREELSNLALCPVPAAGASQSLSQHQIRQLLILSGMETSEVIVTGSETVELLAGPALVARHLVRSPNMVRQAAYKSEKAALESSAKLDSQITPRTLAPPAAGATTKLVQRGAIVTVSARRPGIRITTSGKALDAGCFGDTVNVELADSRERVVARVIGPQTVEIAQQTPASGTLINTNQH